MINNDSNDALEQAVPPSAAASPQHLVVPNGWKLVPVQPTPEIIAGAAIASWPTATLADFELARQAAPLVLMQMDMAPGTTVDAVAGMLATMAPAYRAMLAAAPAAPAQAQAQAQEQLAAFAPQVVTGERMAFEAAARRITHSDDSSFEREGDDYVDYTQSRHWAFWSARATLAAAPVQPVAVPVGWISERTIDSLANARDFAKVPYHHSSTICAARRPNSPVGEACTVPVFAVTAALADAKGLMDKVIRVLEGYAENYDMMSRIGKTGDVDCKSVAHDIRRNMVDGVLAVIAGKAVTS